MGRRKATQEKARSGNRRKIGGYAVTKGRMGGLHRSLRKIVGVPKNAVLLWEGEAWVEDGKDDYSAGTIAIDGPAVRTLRAVCGLHDAE
jgi:hypothetical protein